MRATGGCAMARDMPLRPAIPRLPRALALLLALVVAACHGAAPPSAEPKVALWSVSDSSGVRGWIVGTIHALPPGVNWRRPGIDRAMSEADRLVIEIAEPVTPENAGAALARLAMTPGLPPPSERLSGVARDRLIKAYRLLGVDDARFANEESWAVALQISALASQKAGASAADGIEPQLRQAMAGKPVSGLETIDGQFEVFDTLPPPVQNRLLGDVAQEVLSAVDSDDAMMKAWLTGDELGLSKAANSDFLGDPALHEALLAARNRAWVRQIDTMLHQHARPFIAVGAAHVVGADGLPTLLRARGWTVTRVY